MLIGLVLLALVWCGVLTGWIVRKEVMAIPPPRIVTVPVNAPPPPPSHPGRSLVLHLYDRLGELKHEINLHHLGDAPDSYTYGAVTYGFIAQTDDDIFVYKALR